MYKRQLANTILNRLATETGKTFEPLSKRSEARLVSYAWPGNVRQLENMLRWVATMLIGSEIGVDIIDEAITQFDNQPEDSRLVSDLASPSDVGVEGVRPLWIVEKEAIQHAIDVSDGNINRAAALLEVAPSTIYRKVQAWKDD